MGKKSGHCAIHPSSTPGLIGNVAREWVYKRNCSVSPRQLAMVYGLLCLSSLAIATCFTLRGAWYVFGFAVIEMSAVGWAFFASARHASDREHIALIDEVLTVELVRKEKARRFRFDKQRVRVDTPSSYGGLIGLRDGGMRIEIGRFLAQAERREFARELRSALAPGG